MPTVLERQIFGLITCAGLKTCFHYGFIPCFLIQFSSKEKFTITDQCFSLETIITPTKRALCVKKQIEKKCQGHIELLIVLLK